MSGPEEKNTILIVDDTASEIRVLNEVLKSDYKTIFATNWKDALELARTRQPDLVLLDVMMPEVDGYEVCARLRADPATREIPVIFVTSLNQAEDETKGLELGARDYITKPFKPAVVKARVRTHLLIKRQQAELLSKQKKIEEDLTAAGKIQQCLLPKAPPDVSRVSFAWRFRPCDAVGGDILNVVPLDADHVGLYMVDVAGHGPPSAMVSVLVYQLMNPHTGILVDHTAEQPLVRSPEAVLDILDKEFPLERFDRHFTIIYLVLDLRNGRLSYSNAAHCRPILLRQSGELRTLGEAGTVIGLGLLPFGQGEVVIKPGESVVLYSDGLIEQENPEQIPFGLDRLEAFLSGLRLSTPEELAGAVLEQTLKFAHGQPLADDLSILTFTYHGQNSR